APGSQTPLTAR
ncbi:hypothetical protein C356_07042, partial [Cryptococcus neoformans c45]